tara:strand:- start:140 stop:619 length:480 start_codon:yes stop_codon:yes gene_type:complete
MNDKKENIVAFGNNPREGDKLVQVGNIKEFGHPEYGTRFAIIEHESRAGNPYRMVYQCMGFLGTRSTEHYDYMADLLLIDPESEEFKNNKKVMFGKVRENNDGGKYVMWSIKSSDIQLDKPNGLEQAQVYSAKENVNGIDYPAKNGENKSDDFEDDIPF